METLFLLMKKTRAKKFKVRMFYYFQNLFLGVFVWGIFGLGGFCPGVSVGGFMSRGFCPITPLTYPKIFQCDNGSEFKAEVTKMLDSMKLGFSAQRLNTSTLTQHLSKL